MSKKTFNNPDIKLNHQVVTEEDIKAKFKNGILTLEINKKDATKELPDKKYIDIE